MRARAPYSFKSVRADPESVDSSIQVELTMKSEEASLSPVVDDLMLLISRSHCVLSWERDVEIALREALKNAVFHGNREDPSKQVYISCRCEPSKGLSIVVRDEGEGFDSANVQYPTHVTSTDSDNEHGIPLMRQLMDEVYYELGGRELHMRKAVRS